MRILRNADYDYDSNNVSEINGYTKWYDWNIVKKHTRIINIIITIILVIVAFSFRQSLRDILDITSFKLFTSFILLITSPVDLFLKN